MIALLAYLRQAVASFEADPADTDYQRGYLAAMRNALRFAEEQNEE